MTALQSIEALARRFDDGQEPPLAALKATMEVVRVEVDADPARAGALAAAMGRLIAIVEARQGEIREGMVGAGRGRRAAKGYGGLRSHSRGQRIRIKA